MIRVLEIFGEPFAHGGQESFVVNILQAMDRTGLAIDLLTPYACQNDYYKSIIENMGGSVYAFNLPFHPGRSRRNLLRPYTQFLREHQYDAVHIHSGSISVLMYASLAAKRCGVKKIIVHSHVAGEKKTLKYRLIKSLSRPVLATCPTCYCACSKVAGEWKFSDPIVARELHIIKNGVDLAKFAYDKEKARQIRDKINIPEDAFVIGHVGRFSYMKNHEFLVRVFKEVKKQIPNAVLLLVGDGELMPNVKKQVAELRLEDSVIFTGNVNNVQDYLQAMDVFVLPSHFEGLPIVGVEAQAAGLPSLVSENVSPELKISDAVQMLSIDNVDLWAEHIGQLQNAERLDTEASIQKSGYDIRQTAQTVRQLYI